MYKLTPAERARIATAIAELLLVVPKVETEELCKEACTRSDVLRKRVLDAGSYRHVERLIHQCQRTLAVHGHDAKASHAATIATYGKLISTHDWNRAVEMVYRRPTDRYESELAALLWNVLLDTARRMTSEWHVHPEFFDSRAQHVFALIERLGANVPRTLMSTLAEHLRAHQVAGRSSDAAMQLCDALRKHARSLGSDL